MTKPLRSLLASTFPARNRRANLGAVLVACSATVLLGTGSSQVVLNLVLLLLGAVLFACSPMRD